MYGQFIKFMLYFFMLRLANFTFMLRLAIISMFDKKCLNMKDFVAVNRKEGTWGDSFLDKILSISKNY